MRLKLEESLTPTAAGDFPVDDDDGPMTDEMNADVADVLALSFRARYSIVVAAVEEVGRLITGLLDDDVLSLLPCIRDAIVPLTGLLAK
jgi:hypothetical protein